MTSQDNTNKPNNGDDVIDSNRAKSLWKPTLNGTAQGMTNLFAAQQEAVKNQQAEEKASEDTTSKP